MPQPRVSPSQTASTPPKQTTPLGFPTFRRTRGVLPPARPGRPRRWRPERRSCRRVALQQMPERLPVVSGEKRSSNEGFLWLDVLFGFATYIKGQVFFLVLQLGNRFERWWTSQATTVEFAYVAVPGESLKNTTINIKTSIYQHDTCKDLQMLEHDNHTLH